MRIRMPWMQVPFNRLNGEISEFIKKKILLSVCDSVVCGLIADCRWLNTITATAAAAAAAAQTNSSHGNNSKWRGCEQHIWCKCESGFYCSILCANVPSVFVHSVDFISSHWTDIMFDIEFLYIPILRERERERVCTHFQRSRHLIRVYFICARTH